MVMNHLEIQACLKRKEFALDVDVQIPSQGVTAILGPSGSGKSTMLRLLAGLEKLQQGSIRFRDELWADTNIHKHMSPQKRRIGMVFQDYALFAHMTVAQNIAYGVPSAQRESRLTNYLSHLQIDKLADRYPSQLSGGQRQRVSLARALITKPQLLLLDEPFSAVDANLRQALRQHLKSSLDEASCPALLVTHYLEDVYYLADYIGVMVDGKLLQFGDKQQVLHLPNCKRVAELVGWQNFLPIRGITSNRVYGDWGEYVTSEEAVINAAWLSFRAEHVQLSSVGSTPIEAQIKEIYEIGMNRVVTCKLSGGAIIQKMQSLDASVPRPGEKVSIALSQGQARILPDVRGNLPQARTPLRVIHAHDDPGIYAQHG